ncbi:hypothetical protein L596_006212 [Steinernema carpocapsae]|uniref:Uncharacterized protein n=1 Tax=Steinernema carpocapsae TaxID=34508 RepID=A0A4U8V1E8_STECR|nr:hypothetical protein L596_006212 [Steinernema carpocapsae]
MECLWMARPRTVAQRSSVKRFLSLSFLTAAPIVFNCFPTALFPSDLSIFVAVPCCVGARGRQRSSVLVVEVNLVNTKVVVELKLKTLLCAESFAVVQDKEASVEDGYFLNGAVEVEKSSMSKSSILGTKQNRLRFASSRGAEARPNI